MNEQTQLDRIEAKLDALQPQPPPVDDSFIDALGRVLVESYQYMSGSSDWIHVNRIRADWILAQRCEAEGRG